MTDETTRTAAAEALREAADAALSMYDPPSAECVEWADWLRARADRITASPAPTEVRREAMAQEYVDATWRAVGMDGPPPRLASTEEADRG